MPCGVFDVLQEPIMNAFVFPGGYIVVYTGTQHSMPMYSWLTGHNVVCTGLA